MRMTFQGKGLANYVLTIYCIVTINSEIFARFLLSRVRSFVKIKSSGNGEIALAFTDKGKACPSPEFETSLIVFERYSCK